MASDSSKIINLKPFLKTALVDANVRIGPRTMSMPLSSDAFNWRINYQLTQDLPSIDSPLRPWNSSVQECRVAEHRPRWSMSCQYPAGRRIRGEANDSLTWICSLQAKKIGFKRCLKSKRFTGCDDVLMRDEVIQSLRSVFFNPKDEILLQLSNKWCFGPMNVWILSSIVHQCIHRWLQSILMANRDLWSQTDDKRLCLQMFCRINDCESNRAKQSTQDFSFDDFRDGAHPTRTRSLVTTDWPVIDQGKLLAFSFSVYKFYHEGIETTKRFV